MKASRHAKRPQLSSQPFTLHSLSFTINKAHTGNYKGLDSLLGISAPHRSNVMYDFLFNRGFCCKRHYKFFCQDFSLAPLQEINFIDMTQFYACLPALFSPPSDLISLLIRIPGHHKTITIFDVSLVSFLLLEYHVMLELPIKYM